MACPRVVPDIKVTTFLKNSLCKSLDSVFLRCTVRRDKSPVKIGILAEINAVQQEL